MWIESALVFEVDGAPESTTLTVNDEFPTFVGVPAMVPVTALSVSPAGRLPDTMDHVYGAIPPDAASDAE